MSRTGFRDVSLGSQRISAWLRKGESLRDSKSDLKLLDDDESNRPSEDANRGLPKGPHSPTIQANWPQRQVLKDQGLEQAPLKGSSLKAKAQNPASEVTALIKLDGEDSKESCFQAVTTTEGRDILVYKQPAGGGQATELLEAEWNPTGSTSSGEASNPRSGSVSGELMGTSLSRYSSGNPFSEGSDLLRGSGNPFSEPDSYFSRSANPLFGQRLDGQKSLPSWFTATSMQPQFTSAGSMPSSVSGDCNSGTDLNTKANSLSKLPEIPDSWLSPATSGIPSPARTLSRGQSGVLDRSWSAVTNVNPCAEVLINSFADFSKDMIPPPQPRTPMRALSSGEGHRHGTHNYNN